MGELLFSLCTIYFFGGGFRGNGRAWSRPSCRPAMASSRRSTSEMRCSGLSCQPKTASAEHREGGGDSFFFFMRRLHQQVDRRLIGSVTRGDTFICQVDQAHPQPRVPVKEKTAILKPSKNYVFLDPVNKSRGYVGNLQVQGRPRGSTSSPTKIKKKKKYFFGLCKKKKKKKKKK